MKLEDVPVDCLLEAWSGSDLHRRCFPKNVKVILLLLGQASEVRNTVEDGGGGTQGGASHIGDSLFHGWALGDDVELVDVEAADLDGVRLVVGGDRQG